MTPDSHDPSRRPAASSGISSRISKPNRRTFLAGGALAATAAGAAVLGRTTAPVTTTPTAVPQGKARFADQVVMITGATSGIGRAAAEAFAAEGADVWFCGRRTELGTEVEHAIRASGGRATYVRADVREEAEVRDFADRILATTGRIDVGFNNAGISVARSLLETDTDTWDDIHHTNVNGVYYAMRYQLQAMSVARRGSIVVTSSAQGVASRATSAAYSSSKHAVIGLVQAAALEFGRLGIRVNAVLPGTVDTDLVRRESGTLNLPDAAWQEGKTAWAKDHVPALQRMGTPAEIASVVLDVADNRASFLTGASIPVDGAMSVALP